MKECKTCNTIKSVDEFPKEKNKANGKIYIRKHCYKCKYDLFDKDSRSKEIEKQRAREYNLKVKYNLTTQDYAEIYHSQEGKCALPSCGNTIQTFNKALVIDHDHITGKVRGLLCNNCNAGIGFLRDNYELCLDAAMYLRHHREITD